ncbi:MAG TPA: sulfotransferase [Acidimicrobiales bacterium]|nr:sulfotransferase [Acidimicrobiales bacterium]
MTDRGYTWRDAELRSPPLRALNKVGGQLSRFGVTRPALTPSSIVAAAVKEAGSADLGSESYREPLDVFLRACEDEAGLTTFGRILIAKMLASALANRIALHQWSRDHPEVHAERIHSPWVIVGLPRTGTSVLSMLLGLDPTARPLLQWEAAHLIPPASLADSDEDPRIAQTAKELDGLMKLNPPLKAMHPFGATLAQECVSLFMYDVRTLALETQAHVPSYARWLEQADMTPAYAQHRLALQTLQSRQPTERWVLKTPNHLWHLDALLSAYPEARIIWTHRDPGPVVTSLASLANAGQRPLTWRSDPRPAAEEWKRKCAFALGSAVAFDHKSAEGWCQHVHYDALIADPLQTVRELYGHFGAAVSDLHARRMEAFLRDRPKDAFGRHLYDPADFGWTYAGLAEEFLDYTQRYHIPSESHAGGHV